MHEHGNQCADPGQPQIKVCSIEGCGKPFYCRERCQMHYKRWQKNGQRVCCVEGCGKPLHAAGRCQMHHLRQKQYGSDELPPRRTAVERFWAKVNKNGPEHPTLGRCWDWTAASCPHGYGRFGIKNTVLLAHRFAYMLLVGRVPDDMGVLHRCDRPCCVNPAHLFLGTQQDNMTDCKSKGRAAGAKGESSGSAKLTDSQVLEVRRRYRRYCQKNGCRALAKEHGLSYTSMDNVIKGRTWKHLLHSCEP